MTVHTSTANFGTSLNVTPSIELGDPHGESATVMGSLVVTVIPTTGSHVKPFPAPVFGTGTNVHPVPIAASGSGTDRCAVSVVASTEGTSPTSSITLNACSKTAEVTFDVAKYVIIVGTGTPTVHTGSKSVGTTVFLEVMPIISGVSKSLLIVAVAPGPPTILVSPV